MRFVQLWTSASTGELVQRRGTVGRIAPVVDAPAPLPELSAQFVSQGYGVFPNDGWAQAVIQWPMRSLTGDKRDRRLLERAHEWLETHLDERGLGYVDGFDRGRRLGTHGGFVQNIFLCAVDGPLASTSAMTCLRAARLDATRATIAFREDVEAPWTVRYDRKSDRLPGDFAL